MDRIRQAIAVVVIAFGMTYCAKLVVGSETPTNANLVKLIPAGYRFFEEVRSDLNGDGVDDYVLIIKATDKKKFVPYRKNEPNSEIVDRNRRGIMIFLSNDNDYRLTLENRQCFSSENEDGGYYFAPKLSVFTKNDKLYIQYIRGKQDWWRYTFRYRNTDFELIGYDDGYVDGSEIRSINFLTKKQLVTVCEDKDCDEALEGLTCCNKHKETWSNIIIKELPTLQKIVDFDGFDIDNYIGKK